MIAELQTQTQTQQLVKMTYREGMRQAIREAILRDERVFLMGADVGRYGGCFAVSKGLFDEFGSEKIRDMPLSEFSYCRHWHWRLHERHTSDR